MADILDGIEARHILFLQEERGVALALGEDRNQHVRPRHFLTTGRLDMDDRAVNNALKAGRRRSLGDGFGGDRRELGIEILGDALTQPVDVDIAGTHHGGGVAIFYESGQQVFQRRIFMAALIGLFESAVKCDLQILREGRHC
jgi:hypothetical protein